MEKEKYLPTSEELVALKLNEVPKKFAIDEEFGKLHTGSLFKIAHIKGAQPKNALIFCHGYRPVGIPLASPYAANDNPHSAVYHNLMNTNDYVVASVSYRREGVIYLDAVDDIIQMREYLIKNFFKDNFTGKFILQARSMGGAIVTLLNERYGNLFDGIIGLGSALHINTTDGFVEFLHTPKTKQIFIANCSELGVIEKYVEKVKVKQESDSSIVVPCIFSELAESFKCLLDWMEIKTPTYESKDVTNYEEFPKDNLCFWDDEKRGFWCPLSLTMYYTIEFPMTEENWLKLGIRPRTTFTCEIHTEDGIETRDILFEKDPFVGVPEGTLVAFVKGIGQHSWIAYHFTGTVVNKAGPDLNVRREGNMLFIYEKQRPRTKKVVDSNNTK